MTEQKIQSPDTVAFADLWYATRDRVTSNLPSKVDFSMRKLAPLLPNIALIGAEFDGREKYLLFGTSLAAHAGIDLTGIFLDDTMDDLAKAQRAAGMARFREEFGPDAIRGRWTLSEGRTNSGRILEFEELSLPYREPANGSERLITYVAILGTLNFGEGFAHILSSNTAIWFDALAARPDWLAQDPQSGFLATFTAA